MANKLPVIQKLGTGRIFPFFELEEDQTLVDQLGRRYLVEGEVGGGGAGTDTTAIHDNVANEISAVTEKNIPASGDLLIVEDSAASNVKKRIKVGNIQGLSPLVLKGDIFVFGTANTRLPVGQDDYILSANSSKPTGLEWIEQPEIFDVNAIHDNVAAEISAITEKTSLVGNDLILIEDSEATNNKKRVKISNIPVASHASTHENEGSDEISVEGLSGLLADAQTPLSHAHIAADISDFDVEVSNNSDVTANSSHRGYTSGNPHGVTKTEVGLSNVENIKNNFSATSPPTANDDSDDGYSVGSEWIDVSSGEAYVCVDSTVASAVWVSTGSEIDPGTIDRLLVFSDDTEFSETGTSWSTKKTFRIVRDSAKKPTAWRLVVSLWIADGGTSAECNLKIGRAGSYDQEEVSSTETTETDASILKIDLPINEENEEDDHFLDVYIQLKQTGGGTAHLKYTDLYAIFT